MLLLFCPYPCSILQIALNMLYDTQQQQLPSLKKHKRDDSGDSFMSETTISCIKALGATIGTSPENGVGQDTVDKLYFDSNRSMPKSVTTIDSEANCTNEIARRANGVFVRDFVPISLMPYFKVSKTTTAAAILISNAS